MLRHTRTVFLLLVGALVGCDETSLAPPASCPSAPCDACPCNDCPRDAAPNHPAPSDAASRDAALLPSQVSRFAVAAESPDRRYAESPIMDLPQAMRQRNWGGGSCVHASTVHLLRWQGLHELAEWWRKTYAGGEYAGRLHDRLDKAGLRYAYTTSGDAAFLEWCLRTRRGAGITYWPAHAVNLVHLDERQAGILDNNRIDRIIWVPRDEFIRRWKGYGGWAWTVVYTPSPPPMTVPE